MSVKISPKLIAPYFAVYLLIVSITFYLTINFWPQTNIDSMKKVRIKHGTTLPNISDKLNKKGIITNNKGMMYLETSLVKMTKLSIINFFTTHFKTIQFFKKLDCKNCCNS